MPWGRYKTLCSSTTDSHMTFIRVFGYVQYFPLYFIPLFCLSYPQLLVHNAIIQTWMRDKLTHSWARMRLISQKKKNNGVCKVTGGECGCFQTSPPLSWFSSPAGNIYMHEVAQHFAISLLKSYSSQTVNTHFCCSVIEFHCHHE